mmetsp:Transcript_43041/g.106198  ORF Transcript_43041/g.106198 Transcript_43041/m.106198 type:complete len:217 (+) Transcript_43041:1039-1689(+)
MSVARRCACARERVKTSTPLVKERAQSESSVDSRAMRAIAPLACSSGVAAAERTACTRTNSCTRLAHTPISSFALTMAGRLSEAAISCSTADEMVAVKSSVCLLRGVIFRISSSSERKPSSSRRSASSSTSTSTDSSVMAAELRTRSISRPGVPITRSGRERISASCALSDSPPTTRLICTDMYFASRAVIAWHCIASSRVGSSTSAAVEAERRLR